LPIRAGAYADKASRDGSARSQLCVTRECRIKAIAAVVHRPDAELVGYRTGALREVPIGSGHNSGIGLRANELAGASGSLLKNAWPEELISGVRSVAAGEAVLAPTTTRRLLDTYPAGFTGLETPAPTAPDVLPAN
jgi:hypothetical protein